MDNPTLLFPRGLLSLNFMVLLDHCEGERLNYKLNLLSMQSSHPSKFIDAEKAVNQDKHKGGKLQNPQYLTALTSTVYIAGQQ